MLQHQWRRRGFRPTDLTITERSVTSLAMKLNLPYSLAAGSLAAAFTPLTGNARSSGPDPVLPPTFYRTAEVDGLTIFYRETGPTDAPVILLLHGFPTSSRMFRNLLPALADRYHLIAPDYPGFGHSSAPNVDQFDYTFDHLAQVIGNWIEQLKIKRFSLYVQDYGAPVGYRIATAHPERIQALIVQNGNAYEEGIANDFWKPIKAYWANQTSENAGPLLQALKSDVTKWQYTNGTRHAERIDPDTWTIDQALLDRPGQEAIQLTLFRSYGSNPPLYPKWQEFFRKYQPPTLIVWGKNDEIFPAPGATAYLRDLPKAELHLLDTGHFALEEDGDIIAGLMRTFLAKQVKR
jgi:pimeloyl-ACP methyl ester carboxylesterase